MKDKWDEMYDLDSEYYQEEIRERVLLIMEKTGLSEEQVAAVLKENGKLYENRIFQAMNLE